MTLKLYQNRELFPEMASWTLEKFGGYPKCLKCSSQSRPKSRVSTEDDSEIVMVDLAFGDDFFEQNRSWDDFGTTISGI